MAKKHSIEDRLVDPSDEEWDSDEDYCCEGERQCHEVDEASTAEYMAMIHNGKRKINSANDHSQTHHAKKTKPSPESQQQDEPVEVTAYIPHEFTVCATRFIPPTGICPVEGWMVPSRFPVYMSWDDVEYMLLLRITGTDCKMSTGVVCPSMDGETLPDSLQLEDTEYTRRPDVWYTNSFASTEVAFPSIEGRTFHDGLSLEDIEYMLMSEIKPSYPMENKQEYKPVYRNIGIYKPYTGYNIMHTENSKSQGTQTDLIPTGHLVPPKDCNDDRPIEYKTNMYIKGIKQPEGSKMHELKVRGICLAITAICRSNPGNDKISRDSLMDMFRACQMMKEDDSRLTLRGPSTPYLTPEYAAQLLQKWYLDDNTYFFLSEMDTYISVKKRIECKYIKNENPFIFIQLDPIKAGEYTTISKDTIKGARQNTYYYEHKEITKKDGDNQNPEYKTKRCSFVDEWLSDPEILTTQSLCFNPSCPPGIIPTGQNSLMYNTWNGFAAEKLVPVSETVEQEAMGVFYRHVVKCVEKESADYIMDYIANMFQHPCSKTGVAILLQGVQGCGKGTIFDTIRKVMGDQASFQTGKPTQDLFSRFSQGFKHKILVQVIPHT